MVCTSPPYWGLRSYGIGTENGELGLERTPDEYVANLVEVFGLVRELLADDGTLWLNLGDSYADSWEAQSREHSGKHASNVSALSANQVKAAMRRDSHTGSIPVGSGLKPKDLVGIPWLMAFALRADGWWLRSEIIWSKPNAMPESVVDRPTKSHEQLFLLSKRARYYYDAEAIREPATDPGRDGRGRDEEPGARPPGTNARTLARIDYRPAGRNRRSVWTIPTQPFAGAHFAAMPEALVELCVLAGSRPGDVVLDPFLGSGTVGRVAQKLGRRWLGCELNSDYVALANERTKVTTGLPL